MIFLWLVVPLGVEVSSLELADKRLLQFYKTSRTFVLPISIILTLFKTYKKSDSSFVEIKKIFLTLTAAFLAFLICAFSLVDFSCTSINKHVLFISKIDPSSKIFLREFGCGAWGSADPKMEVVRIDTVLYKFTRTTTVDTTVLDRNIWHRLAN